MKLLCAVGSLLGWLLPLSPSPLHGVPQPPHGAGSLEGTNITQNPSHSPSLAPGTGCSSNL